MKNLLLIFLCGFTLSVFAKQPFLSVNKRWHCYPSDFYGVNAYPNGVTITLDTLTHNGQLYYYEALSERYLYEIINDSVHEVFYLSGLDSNAFKVLLYDFKFKKQGYPAFFQDFVDTVETCNGVMRQRGRYLHFIHEDADGRWDKTRYMIKGIGPLFGFYGFEWFSELHENPLPDGENDETVFSKLRLAYVDSVHEDGTVSRIFDIHGNCEISNSIHQVSPSDLKFSITPNPVQDVFYINEEVDVKQAVLFNLNGERLKVFEPNQDAFNVSAFSKGVYVFKVTNKSGEVGQQLLYKSE